MATSNQGGKQGGASQDKGVSGRSGSVNRGFVSMDPERQRELPAEAAPVARKRDTKTSPVTAGSGTDSSGASESSKGGR